MEQITLTCNHTSIEEAEMLLAGGIPAETADMMLHCMPGEKPNTVLAYDKKFADYYKKYCKPCWSAQKMRVLISEHSHLNHYIDDESLVPALLAAWMLKN